MRTQISPLLRCAARPLALSALSALSAGCGDESTGPTAALSIELHGANIHAGFNPLGETDARAIPTSAEPGDKLQIVAVRPETPTAPVYVSKFSVLDGGGTLRDLPIDTGYRLIVTGLRPQPDGSNVTLFYGGTPSFDIEEGLAKMVSVQVGAPDCVMLNTSSLDPRFVVTNSRDDMITMRSRTATALLPDGRVLYIGGRGFHKEDFQSTALQDIEIYDPRYGSFQRSTATLLLPRFGHTASVLADGRVLVFGGTVIENDHSVLASTIEIINLNDRATPVRVWSQTVPEAMRRTDHQAVHIVRDNGTESVLIAGGVDASRRAMASTIRFFPDPADPAGGRLVPQGDMAYARTGHTLTATGRDGGPAVVGGGLGTDGEPLASIEYFSDTVGQPRCAGGATVTAESGCWVTTGARLTQARFGHQAVAQVDVKGDATSILFIGGFADKERMSTANKLEQVGREGDLYSMLGQNPADNDPPTGELAEGRGEFTATRLFDGRILVVGGRQRSEPIAQTTILTPCDTSGSTPCVRAYEERQVAEGCGMSQRRYGQEAVLLQNGTVLLAGGLGYVQSDRIAELQRAEIFFPRVNHPCEAIAGECPTAFE